ncbi:MAG: hypothetical protein U1E65_29310 [Myxococcota bacterium]
MSTSGISRLQSTQYASNLENKNGDKSDVENAVKDHLARTNDAYQHHLEQIEKEKEARETKSIWTLIGAIFLGPLIGTAIGGAIGDAANDGDEGAAREAKKQVGISDMEVDKAFDKFQNARDNLDEAQKNTESVEKFSNELRDAKFIGTN